MCDFDLLFPDYPPSEYVGLHHLINAARKGNLRAAHMLLANYVYWSEHGEQPQKELSGYLAEAFREVVFEGRDVADALNLKRPRGRPEKDFREFTDDFVLGLAALDRIKNEGMRYRDAIAEVADTSSVSESKVEREYRACKRHLLSCHYQMDPGNKYGLLNGLWGPEDLEKIRLSDEELRRSADVLAIANRVADAQAGSVTEEEAVKQVSADLCRSVGEIRKALQEYDDWLMSL